MNEGKYSNEKSTNMENIEIIKLYEINPLY